MIIDDPREQKGAARPPRAGLEWSTTRLGPNLTVIALWGKLVQKARPRFSELEAVQQALDGVVTALIVDAAGLDWIDSASVGMLVSISGALDRAGGRLAVAGAQGAVAQAFDAVHLHRVVVLFPDLPTALRALGPAPE